MVNRLSRKEKIRRQAKEIFKRFYKTVYQVVLATILSVLPLVPQYLEDSDLTNIFGAANPLAIVVLTGLVSGIDNAIRAQSRNLSL